MGTQPSSSYNRTYAYAASGVLERVVDNDDTAEPLQTLEYFPGQRLEQVTQRDEPNIGVFAYEPQQAGAFKNRPSSIGENNFLYDGRGNQIYREGPDIVGGAQSITYNDLNLPRSILTGAEITSFLYGPGGGRAYTSWTQAQRQTWHVGDLYEKQRTTSGTDTTEGHRYHVFAGGMRIAEVKRTRPNDAAPFTEETTYLHHDRLGTLVASTDDDGELTGEYTYGIFGQPNAPLPVPYGYTGHRYESELGLTDAGGRFYDQKFGIFLSPDPIGPLNGGSAFGNRYSYVGYDPINFIDPTGFQEYAWCTERSRSPGVSNVGCVYVGPEPGYPPPEPDPYPPDHPDDCLDGYCFPPPDDCLGEYCVLPDSPGSSGSTSEAKPRIIATDGQMFGVTGPTSPGAGATAEVASSDDSWLDSLLFDIVVSPIPGLIRSGGIALDENASTFDRTLHGTVVGAAALPLVGAAARWARGLLPAAVKGLPASAAGRAASAGARAGADIVGEAGHVGLRPTQLSVDRSIVDKYAAQLRAGQKVDRIHAVEVPDGQRYIIDGHHRYVAGQQTGIPVEVVVKPGAGPVGFDWQDVVYEIFSP